MIGAALTVLACGLTATHLIQRLDRFGLDVHFRYAGTIEPDDRIVLVDIDDQALADMPEWPWPRRRLAQIVSTLSELGAQAIGLDIIFADATAPRLAGLDGVPIELNTETTGSTFDPRAMAVIRDDDELRNAIKSAGNVYLGAIAEINPPGLDPDAAIDASIALLRNDPSISDSALINEWPGALKVDPSLAVLIRATRLLLDEFSLAKETVQSALSAVGHAVDRLPFVFERAKRLAAARLARQFLSDTPDEKFSAFLHHALPTLGFEVLSPDRAALERAWREEKAWLSTSQGAQPVPDTSPARWAVAHDIVGPMSGISMAARGVGIVSYQPDPIDGRLRSVPLRCASRGNLIPHLGQAIAMDVLGISGPSGDSARRNRDPFNSSDPSPPIDDGGETLINWTRPRGVGDWSHVFTHVPVTRVLEIALNRETILENETRWGRAWAELVELRHADTPARYNDYVRLVNERLTIAPGSIGTYINAPPDSRILPVLAQQISAIEDEALVWLRRAHSLYLQSEPQTHEERAERDRINRLHSDLAEGALAKRLSQTNINLEERARELAESLGPVFEDRICLVGYTASAQADVVATPVFERMPGVMAHANVINMLIQQRYVRVAPVLLNLSLMALAGLIVTWVAARHGSIFSLAASLIFAALLLCGGAICFRTLGVYVATFPALLAVALPWGGVTAHRQLTGERSRRLFQRALSQYTSPAVAARIADRADLSDLAPRPADVTCFFSDLKGFTSLSERLGPARTRDLLNPYLEGVTRALFEHDALVNKFIGDGIFAFLNAPVLPCEQHAKAACNAALDAASCVRRLSSDELPIVTGSFLIARFGLATGPAFVGDYGSESKLDYTCIGDTVNVASRLEQLNKTLGTTILVNEACRTQAGGAFAFRPIGRVRLAGRTQPVAVYELRGRLDEVEDHVRRFDVAFARLVLAYQSCDARTTRELISECRAIHAEDAVLAAYEAAVHRMGSATAESSWTGVIELPFIH